MNYKAPYIESSVFIAYIKGEKKGDKLEHDCEAVVGSILDAARAGDFKVFTSALTIAEVHKKKRAPELSDQENEDLRPYFREDYIQLIEVERGVAERANELCCTTKAKPGRPALRPNDAIHIASAEQAGCDVILSYDPDFTKHQHPTIPIKWPEVVPPSQPETLFSQPLLEQQAEPKLLTGAIAGDPAAMVEVEETEIAGEAKEAGQEK